MTHPQSDPAAEAVSALRISVTGTIEATRLAGMLPSEQAEAVVARHVAPLLANIAALRTERDEARAMHRWNFDRSDGDVLVCRGDHEKGECCSDHDEKFVAWDRFAATEFQRDRVEAENDTLATELAEARAALKPFVAHYEPWMEGWQGDEHMGTYARITFRQFHTARALTTAKGDADVG